MGRQGPGDANESDDDCGDLKSETHGTPPTGILDHRRLSRRASFIFVIDISEASTRVANVR
jgi:hypothetical protein